MMSLLRLYLLRTKNKDQVVSNENKEVTAWQVAEAVLPHG